MSDRNAVSPLADALRALPAPESTPDLWPQLANTLQARSRSRRHRRALAAVAAIALLALLPLGFEWSQHPAASITSTASTAPNATTSPAKDGAAQELASLRQRSQLLQRWIDATPPPVDGGDLMATVEIEDLIGLVDLQLGAVRADTDARVLWRQRIALLEDLATIRSHASYAVAAN